MAKLTVDKGFFGNHREVMEDIARNGYWAT
jgi:hypothetical protein